MLGHHQVCKTLSVPTVSQLSDDAQRAFCLVQRGCNLAMTRTLDSVQISHPCRTFQLTVIALLH